MSRKALLVIAEGSEDLETVTIIDVLRRSDVVLTVASIEPAPLVTGSRGTRIVADALFSECLAEDYDAIIVPGGLPGADRLGRCAELVGRLEQQLRSGGLLGALCAAPARVLAANGLLEGRRATAYPSFQQELPVPVADELVVVDGGLVTSQGPGTALLFALYLLGRLEGIDIRDRIARQMLVDLGPVRSLSLER